MTMRAKQFVFTRLFAFATVLLTSVSSEIFAQPLGSQFFDDLDSHNNTLWILVDGYANPHPFNVGWEDVQVDYNASIMTLALSEASVVPNTSSMPYTAGEIKSTQFYDYGYFEVRMRPLRRSGTVSSFFTYTNFTEWPTHPHDEIDIEFLGYDTTIVQFNFYKNGVGGNEYIHSLGFDAADDFNTYGFMWAPNYITWYVNGVPVYTVHGSPATLPSHPMRIYANLWTGIGTNFELWAGTYVYPGNTEYAEYDYILYVPIPEPSVIVSVIFAALFGGLLVVRRYLKITPLQNA